MLFSLLSFESFDKRIYVFLCFRGSCSDFFFNFCIKDNDAQAATSSFSWNLNNMIIICRKLYGEGRYAYWIESPRVIQFCWAMKYVPFNFEKIVRTAKSSFKTRQTRSLQLPKNTWNAKRLNVWLLRTRIEWTFKLFNLFCPFSNQNSPNTRPHTSTQFVGLTVIFVHKFMFQYIFRLFMLFHILQCFYVWREQM